ncbi:hydroxymethylbilane synthase [Candidatus Pelagibacter sp.]|nr:hydroxymethylbilane synthase [Candidatus Pelagibacter sp.]
MKRTNLVIGTRGSKLAMIYAEKVKNELKKYFPFDIKLKKIVTTGDQKQNERLSEIGGKGLFSNKIENDLLNKNIDIAVHALKDMPTVETENLLTNNFLKRNSPNEILISRNNIKFEDLKANSIIGTSSYRREYQLKKKRPNLKYKLIRGNVDTRVKKLEKGEYDAILLSKAGINALNLKNKISQEFSVDQIIPCAGQGIIAIQCRKDDSEIKELLEKINDEEARIVANAEREVLKVLEGDCDTAIGVFAKIKGQKVDLTSELFSVDGKQRYFIKETVEKNQVQDACRSIGEKLKQQSKGSYKN